MYSTGLMPPRLAMFGVIGGPLIFASSIAVLFGVYDQTTARAGIFALPEIVFEASFAIYLIVKGFRPSHGPVRGTRDRLSARSRRRSAPA